MSDNHAVHTEPDRIRAAPVLAITVGFVVFVGICVVCSSTPMISVLPWE